MKTALFVMLTIALLCPSHLWAQEITWESVSGPHGGFATAIASLVVEGKTIAVASDRTYLYRTENGGQIWYRTRKNHSNVSQMVTDSLGHFWALGDTLLVSYDRGVSWTEGYGGLEMPNALDMAVSTDGTLYVATEGGLFQRTSGSIEWEQTGFTYPTAAVAVDANGTILTSSLDEFETSYFEIFRSTDKGGTWDAVVLDETEFANVHAIAFLPDGTALAGGASIPFASATPGLFRSTDAGANWEEVEGYEDISIYQFFVGGQAVYMNSHRYSSLRSVDLGLTWEESAGFSVTGIAEASDQSILFSTTGLGILHSIDAGDTWTDANEGFGKADIGVLDITDTGKIYTASYAYWGAPTGLFYSDDSGVSWTRIPLRFTPFGVYDLHVTSGGTLLLAPERRASTPGSPGGGLFRSEDEGRTWEDVSQLDMDGRPEAVAYIDETPDGTLWIVVGRYQYGPSMYRSTDDGRTWEKRIDAPFAVRAFTAAPDGSLWVGSGQTGIRVARSVDEAKSWEVVLDTTDVRTSAIAVTDEGHVIVSAANTDYRSPDFGETWEIVDLSQGAIWHEVKAFIEREGSLFGAVDGVPGFIYSSDGGVTWQDAVEGMTGNAFDIAIDRAGHLWSANRVDGLFRSVRPVVTSAERRSDPAVQDLEISAYPNPSGGPVSLRVHSVQNQQQVTIDIIDALGRRVTTLYSGSLSAGFHDFSWDRIVLSPGVYAVRVVSRRGAVTRMVVVK